MIGIRRPDQASYDKRTVGFWLSSYEFALDQYCRLELSCRVDDRFVIADTVIAAMHPKQELEFAFALDRDGRLKDWLLKQGSGNAEFDKQAETALLEATPAFPPLPDGSGPRAEFGLIADRSGIEVRSTLFNEQHHFSSRIRKALRKFRTPPTLYKLTMHRNDAAFEPFSAEDNDQKELLESLSQSLRQQLVYPETFPYETRYVVSLGRICDVHSYSRWSLPVPFDSLDRRRHARANHLRGLLQRHQLTAVELLWEKDRENEALLDRKAALLYECADPSEALAFVDVLISQTPENARYYFLRAKFLWGYILEERINNPVDQVLKDCHAALERLSPGDPLCDQVWGKICVVYATLGKRSDFMTALANVSGGRDGTVAARYRSYAHQAMAEFYERTGDWDSAIEEWKQAIKHNDTESPSLENAKFAMRICEDQRERTELRKSEQSF